MGMGNIWAGTLSPEEKRGEYTKERGETFRSLTPEEGGTKDHCLEILFSEKGEQRGNC